MAELTKRDSKMLVSETKSLPWGNFLHQVLSCDFQKWSPSDINNIFELGSQCADELILGCARCLELNSAITQMLWFTDNSDADAQMRSSLVDIEID